MKRIIIVCEGQTEQLFCNDVLFPHLSSMNIFIETPTIKKTGGGIVNWDALKYQLLNHLKGDRTAYVTTLIDYYGLYEHHNYPGWEEAEKRVDRNERMDILETAMLNDMPARLQSRFKPYIQLHEFEGILFSDIAVFDRNFEQQEFSDYQYLEDTIRDHPNPELINNGLETAPSKRLQKQISGYEKVIYGAFLASEIGLVKIREKCPRFNNWIDSLENI